MDNRTKCRTQNYKNLGNETKNNVMTWFSNDFLGRTPKIYSAEEICT